MKVIVQLQLRDAVKFGSGFSERRGSRSIKILRIDLPNCTASLNVIY